jgi:hypothetical protein
MTLEDFNVGHHAQSIEQDGGKYLAHRELVDAISEGPKGRVFLNADYDHEVVHADHIAGENGLVVAVIAYGRVVSYPMHAVRFIDWGRI